jgi:hypothetical protein
VTVADRYLELALRLGRHSGDLVESYLGPPEIAARAASEEAVAPGRLVADAESLLADLASADVEPARRRWLEAQTRSLHTAARRAAGDALAYPDEVELCFGIRPRHYDESLFARAKELLDEALPGSGEVAPRFARWLESTALPREALLPAARSMADELRERTRELVGLPDGEEIELELVSGKRWSGFNLALGNLRSRISINTDLPLAAADLAYFMAHEGYPGHHADGAWKEHLLVRGRGELEHTLTLTAAPAAVLAEGVAELGRELVLPDEQEFVARHLRPFGIEHDAELAASVAQARATLRLLPANLAILRAAEGRSRDEVREYACRWSPQPPERIEKTLDALERWPHSGYTHCYPEGLRLCRAFVSGDPQRFERLLVEPLVPADLEASA